MRVRLILALGTVLCALSLSVGCGGSFDPLHPYDQVAVDPATTWQKTIGGDGDHSGSSVRETSDGGYIITGSSYSPEAGTKTDLLLVKTDSSGNVLWSRTYGGSYDDYGRFGTQTPDGGYVVTGSIASSLAEWDLCLIKTDSNGVQQWCKTFGGTGKNEGWSVRCTDDSGYIVTGFTSMGAGANDVYLLKTDASGNTQWSTTFGGVNDDRGKSVRQTSDGGYVVAGMTQALTPGDDNAWLLKTDSSGTLQWSKVFGREGQLESATDVLQTTDGGCVLVGYTQAGAGDFDAWMIRTDDTGTEQWNATFGGGAWDQADSVDQASDGGYVLAGMTKSFGIWKDAWLIKTDDAGKEQWSRAFGGKSDEWACSVQQTTDLGYIMAGWTNAKGGSDVYLVYYRP